MRKPKTVIEPRSETRWVERPNVSISVHIIHFNVLFYNLGFNPPSLTHGFEITRAGLYIGLQLPNESLDPSYKVVERCCNQFRHRISNLSILTTMTLFRNHLFVAVITELHLADVIPIM
jgi:hypothetical protein